MTADLSALIARLEAAYATGIIMESEAIALQSALGLEDAYDTDWKQCCWNALKGSLDAALALAERVMEGWYVGVQPWFHTDPDRVMSRAYLIRPDWKRWNPVGDDWCDQQHGRSCASPALAVVSSILRAKQGEGE